ncbi:hypothetical protein D2V08_03310 [Flagellimonas lutimaris]|uniref:Uncharacterized protein n=1 Tax=Flagellimonas lutimaris TaxID=475082 RepID=A0A3A1NFY6_9FLAO|nr:hypothetical protein D2V08_03310 [Allomuricauda lutimaris]
MVVRTGNHGNLLKDDLFVLIMDTLHEQEIIFYLVDKNLILISIFRSFSLKNFLKGLSISIEWMEGTDGHVK